MGLGRVVASLGVFGGVRGVVLGWLGQGFRGLGKVSGEMGEDFWGFGGFGKIWRGLEGF